VDRLLHNLHSASNDNPTFNRTQPRGRVIPVTFSKPEIIQLNCDLHSWMRAWVVVADHPFYALSNEAGEFVLPNVPPGKYVLQIWQETLGTTSREVNVGAEDARVTVELKAATLILFDASHAAECVGSARARSLPLRRAQS